MTNILGRRAWFGATVWALLALSGAVFAQDKPQQVCAYEGVTIRSDFSVGRINACEQISESHFRLTIEPEDTPPINPSPWYAFTVRSEKSQSISIDLVYTFGKHRYWPKRSNDQKQWARFGEGEVTIMDDGSARLTLDVDDQPLYVAGQEMLTYDFHTAWTKQLAKSHNLTFAELGLSSQGRPIYKVETKSDAEVEDYIFIIGRQHPPEITGALALMPFTETLLSDTPLAQRFRDKFGIAIVPALNPDGVENGHWRHNVGGKDLNRDWGPFTQPETTLMRDELQRFKEDQRLWLFLDFHSTGRNLLYTQTKTDVTNPADFAADWVKAVRPRTPYYVFEHAERPVSEQPTSKNYVYTSFGVPSITYEVGDETDRKSIEDAAVVFAEEMMRILLDAKASRKD